MAEADRKFLITILRALIISRKEATINDLCRDYLDTEGRAIPFRDYGFKSLEDFLNDSNEIQVGRDNRIYVRSSAASNHIQKFVGEQNQPKKKRSSRMIKAPAQRRFNGGGGGSGGSGGASGGGGQQNSYRSNQNNQRPQQNAYSTAYHQLKSRSPMKFPKNRSIPMHPPNSISSTSPAPLSTRPSFLITLDGGKYVTQPISNNGPNNINNNNNITANNNNTTNNNHNINNNDNNSNNINNDKINGSGKQRPVGKSSETIQSRLNIITIDNSSGGSKIQQQPSQQKKQPSPDRIVQSDNKVSFNNFTLIPSNDLRHRLNNKKTERKIAESSTPLPSSQQSITNFVDLKISASSNRLVEMPPPQLSQKQKPAAPMAIRIQNNNIPPLLVSANDSKLQNRLKVIQKSSAPTPSTAVTLQENTSRPVSLSSSSSSSLSSSPPLPPPSTHLQPIDTYTPPSKLNDRLKRSQSNISTSNTNNDSSTITNKQHQLPSSVSQQSPNINEVTHVTTLAMYCRQKGYAPPEYKIYKIHKTQRVQCRVMINNVTYSTYPDDYETVQIAKLQTACSAFEQLKESEVLEKFPICMDPNPEIAVKIYDFLKCSTHGMFSQKIPEYFQETYRLSLPEHWLTIIMELPQLFSIVDTPYKKIIYANATNNNQQQSTELLKNDKKLDVTNSSPLSILPETVTDVATSSKITNTKINVDSTVFVSTSPIPNASNNAKLTDSLSSLQKIESNYKYMDKLKLPWQEKYWNLFITNPKSTVEIWGRLIGPDYSDKMDLIIVDIELELMNQRNSINSDNLRVGDIYLVVVNECCNRVRIDKIDMVEQRCLCFYIDIGDEEWFGLNELYECKPEFLKFPAQAVCFSLFGLEDFAENPNSKTHLDDVLTNKTLVGDIASSQEEYDQQEASDGIEPKVQIALYDTSSEEDINLNPVILDKICCDFLPVGLQPVGITNVLITYICDSGEVYCQLRQSSGGGIHYVQKLIHHLTYAEFNRDQHRYVYGGSVNDTVANNLTTKRSTSPLHTKNQQLYLVQDAGDRQWYRAIFLEAKPDRSRMFYVDFGRERMILANDIFRLDSMSIALNRYPHQAILCRLHDVNEMTPSILSSLRGYLNPNTPAVIKIMGSRSTVPSVKIFIRFNEGPLFCINDSIQLEQEIETSPDIIDETLHSSIFSQKILSNGGGNNDYGVNERSLTKSPLVETVLTGFNISKHSQMQQFGGSGGLVTSKCPWPSLVMYNLPAINDIFEIQVTLASNPHHFKVRSHKEMPKFLSMMKNLQEYCSNMPNFIADEDIEEGQAYACQQDDKIWYRVIVTKLFSQTVFMVCYCDFGDIVIVQNNQLKELPATFRDLPQLAITAKLYGITPRNQDWDTEDCIEFQKLTVDKKFVSRIDNILYEQNDRILEMTVIDVSTSIDININDLMLHDGRAIKV